MNKFTQGLISIAVATAIATTGCNSRYENNNAPKAPPSKSEAPLVGEQRQIWEQERKELENYVSPLKMDIYIEKEYPAWTPGPAIVTTPTVTTENSILIQNYRVDQTVVTIHGNPKVTTAYDKDGNVDWRRTTTRRNGVTVTDYYWGE